MKRTLSLIGRGLLAVVLVLAVLVWLLLATIAEPVENRLRRRSRRLPAKRRFPQPDGCDR